MAGRAEPSLEDHLWTVAAARLVFGAGMNIQAPPNLSPGALGQLIAAGINDWGGVSPVTPDHVNPERPWPPIEALAEETAKAGKVLVERLALYPAYVEHPEKWLDPALRTAAARASDGQGYARADRWMPGSLSEPVAEPARAGRTTGHDAIMARAGAGRTLAEDEIVTLFGSRGDAFHAVCEAADTLRAATCRDEVTYVVTRNINYTNICLYRCKFCAFSKGRLSDHLRGRPYDLELKRFRDALWRLGTGAQLKSVSRAEFIPITTALPTLPFAGPLKRWPRRFIFTLFRRSKFGMALRRSAFPWKRSRHVERSRAWVIAGHSS